MTTPLVLPFLNPEFKRHSPTMVRALSLEHGPVLPFTLPSGATAWLVVDHSLVRTLLRDARLSKSRAPISDTSSSTPTATHPLFRHLLVMDPPEHTRLRNIMSRGLLRQDPAQTRAHLIAACRSLIAEMTVDATTGACGITDLITAFAAPLAQRTIAAIVGLPPEHAHLVGRWADDLARADMEDPTYAITIADSITSYFNRMTASTALPADSFCDYLSRLEADGSISADERCAMAFLMVSAGYETSAHLIGSAIFLLLQNAALWKALPQQDGLVRDIVEECLRLCAPLELSTPRFAREPILIADQQIAPGDMVFMALAAANQDPELFPEPACFRAGRSGMRRQLGFGAGVHACLGAAVARLQLQTALVELAHAFPHMRLAQDPVTAAWRPGVVMRGLECLPVRLNSVSMRSQPE